MGLVRLIRDHTRGWFPRDFGGTRNDVNDQTSGYVRTYELTACQVRRGYARVCDRTYTALPLAWYIGSDLILS